MSKITFCIASAKNEKEYTKLLLKSLKENTSLHEHEILIFIDSDNQNTYEELLEIKKEITNIRIYRNTDPQPIGSQRNVSIMFDAAQSDIVCYLQSDMVVGPKFDTYILKNMIDPSIVLTCSRIEPPLHPASPEKIIQNFGVSPEEFQYDKFMSFVSDLQNQNKPNMEGHFAPFAIYKSTWFDKLGGFDTQFRCSREDSDMIIRMRLAGLRMIQTWDACVYHFTCVSSRGHKWFKPDTQAAQQNILQQLADQQELKRFIRKWGLFGHYAKPIYDIGIYLNIDQFVEFPLLEWIEMYGKKLYLDNQAVAEELNRRTIFNAEYYSNLRWNYTAEHWNSVRYLFNQEEILHHIVYQQNFVPSHDVNIHIKYSELIQNFDQNRQRTIEQINEYIDMQDVGDYTIGPIKINISKKEDLRNQYIKIKNNELLIDRERFVFV